MKRFMQVILAINLALVVVIDLVGYPFKVGPVGRVAAAEPILSRQYAAVVLGYGIVLVVFVWRRFQREPVWLLVPATFLATLWLDAIYELVAAGGSISENLPPAIIRLVLVACYVGGYLRLRKGATGRQASARTPQFQS